MQKHVNLVDLVKSFPTNIYLQNLASIQKRTSSIKFSHLAEKSEKSSTSNLSTKARPASANAAVNPLLTVAMSTNPIYSDGASIRKMASQHLGQGMDDFDVEED